MVESGIEPGEGVGEPVGSPQWKYCPPKADPPLAETPRCPAAKNLPDPPPPVGGWRRQVFCYTKERASWSFRQRWIGLWLKNCGRIFLFI